MLLKKCKYPGCNIACSNNNYCDQHSAIMTARIKQYQKAHAFQNCKNPNKELYASYRWRKLRAEWLKDNNYCVFCGSRENLTVDHIERPKGDAQMFFDFHNLRTLCKPCHYRHTGYENRFRGKSK